MCRRGGGTRTAAPIHAATEAVADLGALLVRAPGTVVKADLEVWAGSQRVQLIPPSGQQVPGLTGYELAAGPPRPSPITAAPSSSCPGPMA